MNPGNILQDFFVSCSSRHGELRHKILTSALAAWNGDSYVTLSTRPLPDGTVVVAQANGQVSVLKLQHGSRRISLADAEALLPQLYPGHEIQNGER